MIIRQAIIFFVRRILASQASDGLRVLAAGSPMKTTSILEENKEEEEEEVEIDWIEKAHGCLFSCFSFANHERAAHDDWYGKR